MSRPGESEVKKIISSLIISSARGLTVKKLQYDYREMEGRDIPYRNYGFTSFDQYLRSIPDICRVRQFTIVYKSFTKIILSELVHSS